MAGAPAKRFQLLVAVAAVDGRVAAAERKVLLEVARELGLEEAAALAAIEQAGSQRSLALDKSGDRTEHWALLEQLAAVVRADGVVAPQEQVFLERVAGALGFTQADWQPLLKAPASPKPTESTPPAPASPAPTTAPTTLKGKTLAALPPTSLLLFGVAALLLVAGVLSFATPELLPSQRRILALLSAVLLAGGALKETHRVRLGLWVLVVLTSLTWMARHPLGVGWFGGLCLALGVAAGLTGLLYGGWRPGRAEARAGLQTWRALLLLALLVVLAGGVAAALELVEFVGQESVKMPSATHGTGRGYGDNLLERIVAFFVIAFRLLVELVLAAVVIGAVAAAAMLSMGVAGASVAIRDYDDPASGETPEQERGHLPPG